MKKEGSLSKRIILKKIKNFEYWKMCDPSEKLPAEDQDQDDIFDIVNDSAKRGKVQMNDFKRRNYWSKKILGKNWIS